MMQTSHRTLLSHSGIQRMLLALLPIGLLWLAILWAVSIA